MKEESHQVDKFHFSLFPKYYASEHDTLPTAKCFGSAFVATVSLHEPVKNAKKNVGKKNTFTSVLKKEYCRPACQA
jgi:hypothetical protein